MNYFTKIAGTFSLAALLLLGLSNCDKNSGISQIPNVSVDLVINLSNPSNFSLQPVGGWNYFNGGSRGILVYHVAQDEFKAYDRHSPFLPENGCQVVVDSTGFSAVDPCSGSRFSLFNGGVEKGPASIPLRQYQTTFDGTFIRVRN